MRPCPICGVEFDTHEARHEHATLSHIYVSRAATMFSIVGTVIFTGLGILALLYNPLEAMVFFVSAALCYLAFRRGMKWGNYTDWLEENAEHERTQRQKEVFETAPKRRKEPPQRQADRIFTEEERVFRDP